MAALSSYMSMITTEGVTPKISCLMVTAAGRFDQFKQSCDCYFKQTYRNRELVVVNDGPRSYQRQMADYLSSRPDVRTIFVEGSYTLGSLRNISVSLSRGDVLVQWDDDDFNCPERLAVQYAHLSKRPGARVCYLSDQLHYYFHSGQLFWENWAHFHSGGQKKFSLIPGTVMAWRGSVGRYPSGGPNCRLGEDSVLAQSALDEDEDSVTLLEGHGHMHAYTYHGGNVWGEQHHLKISRERAMGVAYMLKNRRRVERSIDELRLPVPVQVCGRDGHAFTHKGSP